MPLHTLTPLPALSRSRLLLAAAALALLSACQSAPSQPAARSAAPTEVAPNATAAEPAAYSAPSPATPADETPTPPILGKRADGHGCKPSTGHAWCERTQRCERPWELALQRGFENTAPGWHAYCDGAAR